MGDMLLKFMLQKYSGVRSTDVSDMTDLCTRIKNYIWYTTPHSDKFRKGSAAISPFFEPLFPFNNPKRHKHTAKQLQKEILLQHFVTRWDINLNGKVVYQPSVTSVIKTEIENLISSGVKYCDHLESFLASVQEFQSIADEPVHKNTVKALPQVSQSVDTVYKNKRERKVILDIEEKLS